MNCRTPARRQLPGLREWRMKTETPCGQPRFVRQVRENREDPAAVAHTIRQAEEEGAPQDILDPLQIRGERAYKAVATGERQSTPLRAPAAGQPAGAASTCARPAGTS